MAKNIAAKWEKDPRVVELVLRQTNRIVRMDRGVLIVETGPGWVCANAGLDESNSMADDRAILLPVDADASAAQIRTELKRLSGADVAVLVSDTFGRPWRDGLTEVCLGISGMDAMLDLRGTHDMGGTRALAHRGRDCGRTGLRGRLADGKGQRHPGGPDPWIRLQTRGWHRQELDSPRGSGFVQIRLRRSK